MSFQALGAIAKFKRAKTKKKNYLIHQRLPSTQVMSRKVSSNSAQVDIQLHWFGEKQKLFQCCSNFILTDWKSEQQSLSKSLIKSLPENVMTLIKKESWNCSLLPFRLGLVMPLFLYFSSNQISKSKMISQFSFLV